MIVEARAPTRIDLAGGTLDIHPVYLLEDDAWTINVAVEIPATVRASKARSGFLITSQDLKQRIRAESLEALPMGGPLDLACRALRFAAPRFGVHLTLNSAAPPGSGLGASSALLVALLAALDRLMRRTRPLQELVATAWRIETQSIRTLTGRQDHLAAAHGGVNAIRFGVDGDHVEPLLTSPRQRSALQDRLALVYTGQPHASGITNWGVVKAYLDGSPAVVSRMHSVAAVTRQMRDALRLQDLDGAGDLLAEEWAHRRELAPGVSTPEIEKAVAIARRHGAIGGKACGAGGGGCVVVFTRADAKKTIEIQLRNAGFTVLKADLAPKGLQVRTVSS